MFSSKPHFWSIAPGGKRSNERQICPGYPSFSKQMGCHIHFLICSTFPSGGGEKTREEDEDPSAKILTVINLDNTFFGELFRPSYSLRHARTSQYKG
jgi:hypothetical protein